MWLQTRDSDLGYGIYFEYRGGSAPPGPKVRKFKSVPYIMLRKSVVFPSPFEVKYISTWKIKDVGFRI